MKKMRLAMGIMAMLLMAACTKGETALAPVELTISAAASMTQVMEEIQLIYAKAHPDVSLTFNFGSSGALQTQIEEGAPVDVFLSASKGKMTPLKEAGLLLDDRMTDLLVNEMVLIVPKDSTIESFEALSTEAVLNFAMGEPESVPAGKYALEVLDALQLSQAVGEKTVLGKDVKEVLTWVETGNADAGMVYVTDVYGVDAVKIAVKAPEGSHGEIIYPIAVIKSSAHPEEAQAFVDFLTTDEAEAVFLKYGFIMK